VLELRERNASRRHLFVLHRLEEPERRPAAFGIIYKFRYRVSPGTLTRTFETARDCSMPVSVEHARISANIYMRIDRLVYSNTSETFLKPSAEPGIAVFDNFAYSQHRERYQNYDKFPYFLNFRQVNLNFRSFLKTNIFNRDVSLSASSSESRVLDNVRISFNGKEYRSIDNSEISKIVRTLAASTIAPPLFKSESLDIETR